MANLFIIQETETKKYFNAKDNLFVRLLGNSTFATTDLQAKAIIQAYNLEKCEVIIVTEDDFVYSLQNITTNAVLKAEALKKNLEELNYNIPTISGLNKNLKNFLKNIIEKLKVVNPIYKALEVTQEEELFNIQGHYEDMINEISKVELNDCESVARIIKAYHKSPDSINGIVNKILK